MGSTLLRYSDRKVRLNRLQHTQSAFISMRRWLMHKTVQLCFRLRAMQSGLRQAAFWGVAAAGDTTNTAQDMTAAWRRTAGEVLHVHGHPVEQWHAFSKRRVRTTQSQAEKQRHKHWGESALM